MRQALEDRDAALAEYKGRVGEMMSQPLVQREVQEKEVVCDECVANVLLMCCYARCRTRRYVCVLLMFC